MFVVGLIALVAGLVSSPFDEPALAVLMVALVGFFSFSFYVIALIPVIIIPRRCPTCHHRSLICRFLDLTRPLGGIRQCRRCGVLCYRGWSGPWLVLPDFNASAKPQMPDHPLSDDLV